MNKRDPLARLLRITADCAYFRCCRCHSPHVLFRARGRIIRYTSGGPFRSFVRETACVGAASARRTSRVRALRHLVHTRSTSLPTSSCGARDARKIAREHEGGHVDRCNFEQGMKGCCMLVVLPRTHFLCVALT